MSWQEALLKTLLDRWLQIGLGVGLSILFGVGAYFNESWWGAVMMAWSSGAQFGFAVMWFVGPSITARWRAQMEAEIAIMTAAIFARILRESGTHVVMEPPSPPIAPGLH